MIKFTAAEGMATSGRKIDALILAFTISCCWLAG